MVRQKNIFDPNRRPMRVDSGSEGRSSGKERRASYFTLTGTMVAEGRSLAFFSGSRSEYSKVIPVGEVVGGFKVRSISPLQTELERDGRLFTIAVGRSQQIDGSTDEVSVAAPAADAGTSPSPSSSSSPSGDASAPATGAPSLPATTDKSEILRRLMERARAERGGN